MVKFKQWEVKVLASGTLGDDTEHCLIQVENPEDLAQTMAFLAKIVWGSPGYTITMQNINTGEIYTNQRWYSIAKPLLELQYFPGITPEQHLAGTTNMLLQVFLESNLV